MSAIVIQITVRNVYGVARIYPANEAASKLAEIAGTKQLNPYALHLAQEMGMVVEQVAEPQKWNELAA